MDTHHMQFKDVPVGHDFSCNGNWYTKRSTRTARLQGVSRTFYFGMKEPVVVPTPATVDSVNSEPPASYATQIQLEAPLEGSESDPVIRQALTILAGRLADPGPAKILSDTDAADYFRLQMAGQPREVFSCLWLNNQHQALKFDALFFGTLTAASVYPREVVKAGLSVNAAAVVLCHNHPAGDPEPSDADIVLTRKLKEALAMVDIRVLDHVIVGGTKPMDFASLAARGQL